MGFFDFFKKKEKKEEAPAPPAPVNPESISINVAPNTIYQPITGNVITLEEIPDPVFSSGALGKGCGVEPSKEVVYAPIDSTVSTVAETKHAVGLTGADGIEMLIHVGIDTVSMNGTGFNVLVNEGDFVTAGQPVLTFSKQAIKDAGFSDTTAVLVINADLYPNLKLEHTGPSDAGSILMTY